MKKLVVWILMALSLGLIAIPASASEKKITIGWAMAYFDHPVYQLLMKGAQELADGLGRRADFADGKNDPNTQASQIDTSLRREWTRSS